MFGDEEKKQTLFDKISMFCHKIKHWAKDLYYELKWFIQKISRPKHFCSDYDLWGLYGHLAKVISPKLVAFRKYPLHGNPRTFCEYEEDSVWKSKEKYDKAKEKGDVLGGGSEGWLKTIDEMIFAFEFILVDDDDNKRLTKKFYKKYGNWFEEIPENKKETRWYKSKKDDCCMMTGDADKDVDKNEWEYKDTDFYYYNNKLYDELNIRCQKGLELFGRFFRNLWD